MSEADSAARGAEDCAEDLPRLDRPLKIGVTCYPTYGGSGVLATELGKELAARGHEIHFITSAMPYRLHQEFHENIFFHEVQALHYPVFEHTPYALALAVRMAEVYRQHRLDLFHVHYAVPHAASAYLAREMLAPCKAPIITTLHGTDVTLVGQDSSYQAMVRFCLEKSDAVTAVSDWLRAETERVFRPSRPIVRIHNFADPELFRPGKGCRARFHFARPDQKIILHASNFRPVKRVPDVVRAFALVRQAGVDAVLALVGDGPELAPGLELASQLGVRGHVHALGMIEDVSQMIASCDLVLFPSAGESFGLVPLEAMLSEVPVIGARAGGLVEVIDHGVTGFLADVGDAATMARHAVEILTNGARHREMGRTGRRTAIERFAPERIIPQYERLYLQNLSKDGCCQ